MARLHPSTGTGRARRPSGSGPQDYISARIAADFALQLDICDALESLADSLPCRDDMTLARMLAAIAEPSWAEHVRFQEAALFPVLKSLTANKRCDACEGLDALEAEHGTCLGQTQEMAEQLRFFVAGEEIDGALMGYTLRSAFDGRRRHIEREQALLTPLLPDILKSSHRSQLESWLVSNAWPGLHTAFVKYRSP
jgi:hypothetical protein